MTTAESTDALHERANELYWNSPDTVDQVAGQLGMTRNTLYGAVRPLPAGAACPDCGDQLVFPNRTTRAAGRGMCLACDRTVSLDEISSATRADAAGTAGGVEIGNGFLSGSRERLHRFREDLSAVERERVLMIGTAAALGVLFGVAAGAVGRRLV
ncbi:MAG: hypothetical protein M3P24_04095 [Gemmatimonadota bacterium]|nr:hypothetical protein [Gemmatimonadota bacterium]